MAFRKLHAAYALASLLMVTAGAITIAFSIIWRAPDLLKNFVITSSYLTAGLILGVLYLVSFAIAIGAIVQPAHVTVGLIALNWTLVLDAVVTLIIGTIIWFSTLKERNNFHQAFSQQGQDTRQGLQDLLKCCGYFNFTDLGVSAGFCSDPTSAANATPCVGPITASADYTLNNIFSTIYGFMAVILFLFLASMCVIKVRQEEERFRKIDDKRGGGGFV